jgi:hypothetical protein
MALMINIRGTPKWWLIFARVILIVTIGTALLCSISFWSLKSSDFAQYFAGIFGNDSLGQGIGIITTYMFSYYAVLSFLLLAVIGVLIGAYLKYPLKDYVVVFVITSVLVLYINAYG